MKTLKHISCCIALALFSQLFVQASLAQNFKEPAINNEDWIKPYAPFRIAGNLYYVGTLDLGCYLIVTPKGNVLINTGTAASLNIIRQNIETLGFKFKNTKILLTTQAHYDHVGALAAIKRQTGARLLADYADAQVLADGGKTDYEFGSSGASFAAVKPDGILKNGDKVQLGGTTLTLLHHPGHTKGSCSYLVTVKDAAKTYRVLIANLPSIVTDKPFSKVPGYPNIARDYAQTFASMKNVKFDLWVASHASQFKLADKHKPGDAYAPEKFADQQGYQKALQDFEQAYKEKLAEEK